MFVGLVCCDAAQQLLSVGWCSAAVSDMANGGQVLLEANTFNGVKNRLTEVGTIDHRGYNDKLRANASRALWQQTSMSWLTSCYG